jgi:hypothetical protein
MKPEAISTALRRAAVTSPVCSCEQAVLPTPGNTPMPHLRDFQTYGSSAAQNIQDTLDLISRLAKAATA